MQLMGILIELRGEGAAITGIYRHTWRSGASSTFVLHVPYKVTPPGPKGTAASITKGESFSKLYMDGGVQHMTIFI